MAKIIRLTEDDLTRLVQRVIKEQSESYNLIKPCAELGVKSPGKCDTKRKTPIASCASLGVKTTGYCYVDTKKPVPGLPTMNDKVGKTLTNKIKEQVLPGLSSGNSAKAVADIFRSCNGVQVSNDPKIKQVTDSIYRAIQGLGTNEQAIMQAFSTLRSKNEFCGVNKMYLQTYGTNLYTDLDGDIDQEPVWANISRILRNLQIDPKMGAVAGKTGPGAKPTAAKQQKNARVQNLAVARQQQTAGGTKPTDAATAARQRRDARTDLRRQQTAGGVKPTLATTGTTPQKPTSRMPVR